MRRDEELCMSRCREIVDDSEERQLPLRRQWTLDSMEEWCAESSWMGRSFPPRFHVSAIEVPRELSGLLCCPRGGPPVKLSEPSELDRSAL
jgi:hypothetical protein